jgi:hypothetical protein
MSASAELREQVLTLVADGQLPAEAAQQLLERLSGPPAADRARLVRVRISDLAGGRLKATVTVPVGLFAVGMRLGARLAPPNVRAQLPALVDALAAAGGGRLLDWRDVEGQERFELFVE